MSAQHSGQIGNAETSQQAVVRFLANPQSHGLSGATINPIVTHAAMVFVAGDTAYKIKRAVKLPYLDFSSLEARKTFLERELTLNKPIAPEIYLDVVPIYSNKDATLSFSKPQSGHVADWCLVMRAFKQSDLLSRRVATQDLGAAWVPALVGTLHKMHDRAAPVEDVDQFKSFERILDQLNDVLGQTGTPLNNDAVRAHISALRRTLEQAKPKLHDRAANGFVRRCHGDLHLGNIVIIDGRPVPFDALEFDEELATIDVLYDLAFLLMDLWRFARKREANVILNLYISVAPHWQDLDALRLLPLFLSLRASIRVMVALQRMSGTAKAETGDRDEVHQMFELAQRFLTPGHPQLIAVGGLSGTGKSTLSAALAPFIGNPPGAIHVRSDIERKRLFGVAPTTRLGEEAYRKDVTARVYDALAESAATVLGTGHSVIVDAVFAMPPERRNIEQRAQEAGAEFHGLWLHAAYDIMIERVAQRRHDASDAGPQVVEKQLGYDIGDMNWDVVSSHGTPDEALQRALTSLEVSRP